MSIGDGERGVGNARSTVEPTVRFDRSGFPGAHAATRNEVPLASILADEVSARVEAIKKVWSQGAGNSIELARVVWQARRELVYGQWTHMWASGVLPFSKRKGEMLATVGKGLGWVDAKTFAHLPSGWSVLYQLAQLSQTAFEELLEAGVIHPRLTLREAKELLARFKGRRGPHHSHQAGVKHRLRQFGVYVRRTLRNWNSEERAAARTELTRLLELIDGTGDAAFVGPLFSHKISVTTPRPSLSLPGS